MYKKYTLLITLSFTALKGMQEVSEIRKTNSLLQAIMTGNLEVKELNNELKFSDYANSTLYTISIPDAHKKLQESLAKEEVSHIICNPTPFILKTLEAKYLSNKSEAYAKLFSLYDNMTEEDKNDLLCSAIYQFVTNKDIDETTKFDHIKTSRERLMNGLKENNGAKITQACASNLGVKKDFSIDSYINSMKLELSK